ncbi:MAG: amidohydrolase [Flavobacterium sp.]|nr:amidohydrolase [Flavobacterium sp.]
MKIALIQTVLQWEDAVANCNNFEIKINSISEKVDLIVLPEMFSTGFSMQPENCAETMKGATVSWMKLVAVKGNFAICGSVIIKENSHFCNRFLFVFPSGEVQYYDKRHLFSLAGEDKIYKKGETRLLIDYNGFKICPLICYDLRFPVFSRNTDQFDLLIYTANWPKPRVNAWDILLKARAVENMCFVVGVNRIGNDSNYLDYVGHSQIIDFMGNEIIIPTENEGVFIAEITKEEMLETRRKLPFLEDRDRFEILNLNS